ncbi:MAG TPA: helix-turn-helix domain-containing protein [Candidatus Aenigmarchaeota archaeon]|nr:helix-turn-helix domain-containing protein [Candidatus Aenigmarchaeota archaeon]
MNKNDILSKVIETLLIHDFSIMLSKGCFDVAAKRDISLLIKVLTNIDGLLKDHAISMKIIAKFLSANPMIVSLHTNRDKLLSNVIYSRFDIPVVTPETFETLLFEDSLPHIYSTKGKHLVEINAKKMRRRRIMLGMSMKQLALKTGLSVKAIYEIESERVRPTLESAKAIEDVLGIDLILPYRLETIKNVKPIKPRRTLERYVFETFKKIGIETSALLSSQIDIIGKESEVLVTVVNEDSKKLGKRAISLKKFVDFFSSQGLFIVEKSEVKSLRGLPIIERKELSCLKDINDFRNLLEERRNF